MQRGSERGAKSDEGSATVDAMCSEGDRGKRGDKPGTWKGESRPSWPQGSRPFSFPYG